MGTATVLVVDDERKIRHTVRAFLERQRYPVLVAATRQQALDVAGRLKPDLVVRDLMLPEGSTARRHPVRGRTRDAGRCRHEHTGDCRR